MNVFKELYKYRELLKSNTKKEVRGKYKHSFLGVLWSFLNPLLQIMVYAIVFPLILRNKQEHYLVFLCCGLIPWNFFSISINRAAGTMLENGNIIKKVYFPREILPISIVSSEAINFLISTLIILAFVIFDGISLTAYLIYYPLILVVQYILILAISLIISAVTVYIRDLQHLISVILQLFFYATPIVYAANTIPQEYAWILQYNPMTYIINGYRDIFLNQTAPDVKALLILLVIVVILCAVAYAIFHKLQKGFAEEL